MHSQVLAVCFRKEKEIGRVGLVNEFINKMRKSAKQRVVNEHQMIRMTDEKSTGLDLA